MSAPGLSGVGRLGLVPLLGLFVGSGLGGGGAEPAGVEAAVGGVAGAVGGFHVSRAVLRRWFERRLGAGGSAVDPQAHRVDGP